MANKDFFDEEYDKQQAEKASRESETDRQFNSWSNYQPPQSEQVNTKRPLYIAIICVALVLCIVLGWVLCAVFGGSSVNNSREALLKEVLRYLDNEYYKEIPDEKMWKGIEAAGTALLQTAGDQYSRLMSPSTFYQWQNPSSDITSSNPEGVFGVGFQFIEGIGAYVSSVTVNSSAYGRLEAEDIIVKLTDVVSLDGRALEDLTTNNCTSEYFEQFLFNVRSATFRYLRNGETGEEKITRSQLQYVNENYKYDFVEFYFGDDCTNVSLSNVGYANTNVKDERLLGELAKIPDTGYVRIDQFMSVYDVDENGNKELRTAADEFEEVMDLFAEKGLKHLILDLKGNPGGGVEIVCDVASRLITASTKKLTSEQIKRVTKNDSLLVTTLIDRDGNADSTYVQSKYHNYFGELGNKTDIVVWTDGGSASASELLTGALRDYGTAEHMGVTTYGKGIAQIGWPLNNYTGTFVLDGEQITYCWAIYYTCAEYFSPLGDNIHGDGYTPSTYNNLDTYEKLWKATANYFNGTGGGMLA
ncbi:MAG: S41 family peptidase [Firmicutes bacterium]|nr:S41 family peptidase [Bacillota bacterium]